MVQKMKKLFLIISMLLFIIPLAFANTDYNESGNFNHYYQTGFGQFNENVVASTTGTTSISTQRGLPLVSDLDGDGTNEIIVLDGDSLKLFQNKELVPLSSADIGNSQATSNMIAFDIDGDNFTEIILHLEVQNRIVIFEYNGSVFKNQTTISTIPLARVTSAPTTIGCRGVNDCLFAFSNKPVSIDSCCSDGSTGRMRVAYFNSSGVFSETLVGQASGGSSMYCMPQIRHMAITDFDGDGTDDYIFSAINYDAGGVDSIDIFYIDVDKDATTSSEIMPQIEDTEIVGVSDLGGSCDNYDTFFSSPLVKDLTALETGMETVFATMTNDDHFNIKVYKEDGSQIRQHPATTDGEGVLVSNIMLADIFPESDNDNYCVVGYDTTDQDIDLMCASLDKEFRGKDEREFILQTSGLWNISSGQTELNSISHMSQHSDELQEEKDIHELINSYGVLRPDLDSCPTVLFPFIEGECDMTSIFENPKGDSVVIPVDVEKVTAEGGQEDLLILTDNNLFYLDDGFSNSPATITEYRFNPCRTNEVWKINTTVKVTVEVTDIDSDQVSSSVIMYEGDGNEDDSGFSSFANSGTSEQFTFTVNKTITNGNIKLRGRDIENNETIDEIDLRFNVAESGLEFGDCEEIINVVTITEAEAEATVGGELNESSNIALSTLSLLEATGLGGFLNSILIMLFVAFLFIFAPHLFGKATKTIEPILLFSALILVEVLLLFFFTILGTIPVGVTISLVVIAIIPLGLWVRNMLTGANNNGGMG